jgi:hypothetical protein
MARTFRLRHCPSLPGTAKHFAFTRGSAHFHREEAILEEVKRLAPEVKIKMSKWKYLRFSRREQDGDARSVLDMLEYQIVVPLLSPHFHPWRRRYGINVKAAKYYRQVAHRNIRRITKHVLNKAQDDYDNMILPAWYEYFDRWNFT